MNDIDRDRFIRALEYAERKGDHSDPVDSDRDMVKEAYEELLDALNYLQWAKEKEWYAWFKNDVDKASGLIRSALHEVLPLLKYLERKEGE